LLYIQVSSSIDTVKTELEFLQEREWTNASEQLLLQQIKEILSLVRLSATKIRTQIELTVEDPSETIFQIRKTLNPKNDVCIKQHKLSIREIEVLGLIMLGLTNQEIADKLFICFETVRSHRKNILEKTGAKNTAALINYYHQTFLEK
jgi:DNA-binding NarL/FixJ family response regulator